MKRLLLVFLGACTSNLEAPPDSDIRTCDVQGSLDGLTATNQRAEADGAYLGLVGGLADDRDLALPEVLSIELYAGSGAFESDPIVVGTYPVESQYETCGVCVLVYGNFDDGALGQTMLATSGTLSITAVDDRLTGTLLAAELHEVAIDDSDLSSTEVMGGCVTTVTSLAFDAVVER